MKNFIKNITLSGTNSFDIIFKNLNFEKGSEVIVPVTLCESVIKTIRSNGLIPIFVDIDDNFLIDKKEINKKISFKTKIIVFVEQYGNIVVDNKIYYSKRKTKIIKILDSCQNGIKNNYGIYDYIIYSFNNRKPISFGKYSYLYSKKNLKTEIKINKIDKIRLFLKIFFYRFNYFKKKKKYKYIKDNLMIPGRLIDCDNFSYHRVVFVIDIDKESFSVLEDKLYKYMEENNSDILQTTIEKLPFEIFCKNASFSNIEKLRYKTLYFRMDKKIKDYKKIINYINEVYYEK